MRLLGPPNVEELKSKEDVAGLIKALEFKKDPDVRKAAAKALGELESNAAVDPLLNALEDDDKGVRMYAAGALDSIGDTLAVDPLIERLKTKGEYWRVQLIAVIALGNMGDTKALPSLVQILKAPDSNFRSAAAEALGKIGDPEALHPLLIALKDEDSFVRLLAARALGDIGDPGAVMALKYMLDADDDQKVRETAEIALTKIGTVKEDRQNDIVEPIFVRKDQKGVNSYEIYKGENPESARAFLRNKKIDRPKHYVNVETPKGIWGRDKEGIYLVYLLPWQKELDLATCEGRMVEPPSKYNLQVAIEGIADNFVATIRCGECEHEWLDGLRYQNLTVVLCPKCKTYNKVDSRNLNSISG